MNWTTKQADFPHLAPQSQAEVIEGDHAEALMMNEARTIAALSTPTLFTVATDGTGHIIALDAKGTEIARVYLGDRDEDDPAPFTELARRAFHRLNAEQ